MKKKGYISVEIVLVATTVLIVSLFISQAIADSSNNTLNSISESLMNASAKE